MWRAAHWANWAFEIESYDNETIVFGKGGYQGARGGPGSDYFVENSLAFLDAPTEWFFSPLDDTSGMLYYFPNATGAPSADLLFTVPTLATLILVNASQAAPATGVTLSRLGFRDTRNTFLDTHAVPSAGDWLVYKPMRARAWDAWATQDRTRA